MKLRPILTEHDRPIRFDDGGEESYRVHIERQDGTIATTGEGFETPREARLCFDGAALALRAAGILADPLPPLSHDARKRLDTLRRRWEQARYEMEAEARRYAPTAPPSSVSRSSALWHARRYRLALWVCGRAADARTVTP